MKLSYSFDDGSKEMKHLLGGKGANLAEMTKLGIPVPPGFTITTEVCAYYNENNSSLPKGLDEEIEKQVSKLEEKTGKTFGGEEAPLLMSVRSGAVISMPGMMDTVLNLGLNDEVVKSLVEKTGNEKFVLDSYRRLINMFGDVVLGVDHENFEKAIEAKKQERGVKIDNQLTAEDLRDLVETYKNIIKEQGKKFPQDVNQQLVLSILAVFKSWGNDRAVAYRRINSITGLLGTAVNVQAMVFGNMNEFSGTGVAFTRNPSTGENKFYGEYLMNAQGEDVVSGIRTPQPIQKLEEENPAIYKELTDIYQKLENHYKDMQDIEFTIENGTLYMLQTRSGKRTAHAAIKIATDMVKEGLISKEEAILRIEPDKIDQLLHKTIDTNEKLDVIAKGLPASPGAAVGQVVFTADKAYDASEEGKKVILVRTETSPEDIEGMNVAQGILTSRGGMTSHAAVVARGMGTCCIAGCAELKINEKEGYFTVGEYTFKEGDFITLNGSTGEVIKGEVKLIEPGISGDFEEIMRWADEFRKLGVRTNADTPHDAQVAINFGAEGIGLCRTEHMFFNEERIKAVREMILSDNEEDRRKALDKLLPFQKSDFVGLFKVMNGLPITIRLLDPPLHEFLPKDEGDIEKIATEMGVSVEKIKENIENLNEFNPMLGHRGCRLAITYPEIVEMQTEAIVAAAIEVAKEGIKVSPEIMIPLVGHAEELKFLREKVIEKADEVLKRENAELEYKIGTMIEVPRGAITADALVHHADFFSFGTNDLTQMTLGFSRDDSGSFIKHYLDKNIITHDPFQSIDESGVGELMKIAVEKGRKEKSTIKIGICGEHGGEPQSISFCHSLGLDYVSCSPYRVPIARLAAAQAALRDK